MKKVYVFATLVLILGTSCSKDKVSDVSSKIDDTTTEEINLGTGESIDVINRASRGVGSVGGLNGDNLWNGETVYVYGVNNGAYKAEMPVKTIAINGQAAMAPKPGSSGDPAPTAKGNLTWVGDNVHYYYNGNDVYDFYAAHIDDAVSNPETAMKVPLKSDPIGSTEPSDLSNGFSVELTLDGTQDIMVASTKKEEDISGKSEVTGTDRVYSAWSARREVIPNLKFNHIFTQLRFKAKTGLETPITEDANAIKITSIEIKDVVNAGALKIIPSVVDGAWGTDQGFTPTPEAKGSIFAKAKPAKKGDKLTDFPEGGVSVIAKKTEDFVQVSAPVLLYPEAVYNVVIRTSQLPEKGSTPVTGEINGTLKAANATGGDDGLGTDKFQPGTLYDINITVYNVEKIVISGELIEWKNGGDINIDPDELPNLPEGTIQ